MALRLNAATLKNHIWDASGGDFLGTQAPGDQTSAISTDTCILFVGDWNELADGEKTVIEDLGWRLEQTPELLLFTPDGLENATALLCGQSLNESEDKLLVF